MACYYLCNIYAVAYRRVGADEIFPGIHPTLMYEVDIQFKKKKKKAIERQRRNIPLKELALGITKFLEVHAGEFTY